MPLEGNIIIRHARENNLKDVSIEIPRNRLVVITGISGSGKSSLAFDTLFAEGQRRFAESLSSYARQFLGRMSKPDVERIDGLPPAIAIEQKVNVRNPRSTVATTTEIIDYLRLVFARIGRTYSPVSGEEVRCHGTNDVMAYLLEGDASSAYVLADFGWKDRKDRLEALLTLMEQGFSRLWTGDAIVRIEDMIPKAGTGEFPDELFLLVDRVRLPLPELFGGDMETRLRSSVDNAFSVSSGSVIVRKEYAGRVEQRRFSSSFEADGISFRRPEEYMFSFNSPLGACQVCGGLGQIVGISEDLVVPDKSKSIYDGAISCWRGEKMAWFKDHLISLSDRYHIPIFTPYRELSDEVRDILWNGRDTGDEATSIVGINEFFKWVESNKYKIQYKYMLSRFSGKTVCSECRGSRLRKDALYVKVYGKNIHELLCMTVRQLIGFFDGLELSGYEKHVAGKAIEEIVSRLKCIDDVGLAYLTLNRACNTLSGGESQRINLVTAIGSSLVGSMYILDEPSIGLHPRDTERLISVFKRLRDIGNTVIVVEHDENIIRAADMLIDMGPKAGVFGGDVVFQGRVLPDMPDSDCDKSLTLQYICGKRQRAKREKRKAVYHITVEGAMEHNLKDVTVDIPLGVLTVVTGVSGSGKSSLVGDILYPALYRRINESGSLPGSFRGLSGSLDRITQVEYVDQNPIGKSSRSNAVTYLKVYDDIRRLMAGQQYARINSYTPSFFSFNQDGGRCPECQGEGYVKIGLQFMADVRMVCESCGGKRFKPDILEVRYKGKNIDDILNMSVSEAIGFFSSQPEEEARTIAEKLRPLVDVGLSYIKLGQSNSTLSGGESQRVKLAYFLSMSGASSPKRNSILFIFDEPTTGLHFNDVEKLLHSFDALLAKGHSIVVVEHNIDVIKAADHVIDLGPDAGDGGGRVVFEGSPEEMAERGRTVTSGYLREN